MRAEKRGNGFGGLAALCVAGAIAALSAFVAHGGSVESRPALAVGAYVAAGGLWWWAVARAARGGREGVSARVAVAGALIVRAAVWGTDPGLSDDVHRYVLEGALVTRGANPYAYAPEDPALDRLVPELEATRARVNHPEVPAAYPPATELASAAGVALGRALGAGDTPDGRARSGVRALYALCDLFVLVPLLALLRALRRPAGLLVVWGWSPLAAIELSGSAHFDALAILAMTAALAWLARPGRARDLLGSAALAVAVLSKLLPVALAPFLLRSRARAAAFGLTALALLAPFLIVLHPPGLGAAGLSAYAFRWEATSLVYRFVQPPFERLFDLDESLTDPRRIARALVALAWLVALGVLLWRRAEPWRAGRVLVGLFLVLSPTLHPWYVTWILPFAALSPGRAWLWLATAIPLAYAPLAAYRAGRGWNEPAWTWPVLALPFFLLLALDARRASGPRTPRPSHDPRQPAP